MHFTHASRCLPPPVRPLHTLVRQQRQRFAGHLSAAPDDLRHCYRADTRCKLAIVAQALSAYASAIFFRTGYIAMTLDFNVARQNMVSNQVRSWEVLDPRVLDTLGAVRREDFVPVACRAMAFADLELPLGHGEIMMKPVLEGRLLQALEIAATDSVLEIGTGSGFLTACLARLAASVTSLDIRVDFTASAKAKLQAAGCGNVELATIDAVHAFAPAQRYDAIAVTGAVADVPGRWLEWLKPGGRMFVVQGQTPVMRATLMSAVDGNTPMTEFLFETDLPYLQNAGPVSRFRL